MLNKISKNNLANIVSTARFTMVNLLFFFHGKILIIGNGIIMYTGKY